MNSQKVPEYFGRIFNEVKKLLLAHYKIENDGSGPPHIVALRKAVENLPFGIKIVELKIDKEKYPNFKDHTCQLMKYDFSQLGTLDVNYYGAVNIDNKEGLLRILSEDFGLSDPDKFIESFYPKLDLVGWWDPESDFYIAFPHYDIMKQPKEFIFDLSSGFSDTFGEIMARKFKTEDDYAIKNNLRADPIFSLQELLKRDSPYYPNVSIEGLQEEIKNIQLLPTVPESVERLFKNAKELYLFGYFRYRFFTIASHYAWLALESAMKNRYILSFGDEIILRNRKGKEVKMSTPNYENIVNYCSKNKGWAMHDLSVNGEKFPSNKEKLSTWLVSQGLISEWEKELCIRGLRQRNFLSHQTFAPIYTPGNPYSALVETSTLINKMYSP